MKTYRLYFDPGYARHMRDLCLLSILEGKVAHFPDALRGTSIQCRTCHIQGAICNALHCRTLQGRIPTNAAHRPQDRAASSRFQLCIGFLVDICDVSFWFMYVPGYSAACTVYDRFTIQCHIIRPPRLCQYMNCVAQVCKSWSSPPAGVVNQGLCVCKPGFLCALWQVCNNRLPSWVVIVCETV